MRNFTDVLRPLTAHSQGMRPLLRHRLALLLRRRPARHRMDKLTAADRARIERTSRRAAEALRCP